MGQYLNLESQDYTFIGKNSKIKGEFHFYGPTTVAAQLEGSITISENSLLRLDRNSSFLGEIRCQDIQIYGNVEGSIFSSGKVTLFSTASFKGVVKAKSLDIHPGAKVDMEGDTDE